MFNPSKTVFYYLNLLNGKPRLQGGGNLSLASRPTPQCSFASSPNSSSWIPSKSSQSRAGHLCFAQQQTVRRCSPNSHGLVSDVAAVVTSQRDALRVCAEADRRAYRAPGLAWRPRAYSCVQCSAYHLVMVTNCHVTGLCVQHTMLSIIVVECTLSTDIQKFAVTQCSVFL